MKLKICGMNTSENIESAIKIDPDYMGFIFYKNSSRNFKAEKINLPKKIKRVGVFVNSEEKELNNIIEKFKLNAVQLHGDESPEYCSRIKKVEVIKAFSVDSKFNFDILKDYEDFCDYYLFDTKGKLRGGNGSAFDWNLLKDYPSQKKFFLSGGIGLDDVDKIEDFNNSILSEYCMAIDINSRFEIQPGLKDIDRIKKFKEKLKLVFN